MTPQELVYRNRLSQDWRAFWEERSAILEFEAGLEREQASKARRFGRQMLAKEGCQFIDIGNVGGRFH